MNDLLRNEHVRGVLILIGLSAVGYGFLLTPGEVPYSPHSDIIAYSLRAQQTLHESLMSGNGIPFWQPYQLSGGTALTNPQSLYTYPLHLMFYLLPPESAVGPTLWLDFLVAGLALYSLGAALELSWGARVLMGAAGLFNFKLIVAAYAGWLPVLPSIALCPLLASVVVLLARRPDLPAALAFTLTAALCLHAGHLQLLYYTTGILLVYLAARAVGWIRNGEMERLARVVGFSVAGSLTALGLSAYLLLPLLLDTPLVGRSDGALDPFAARYATSLADLETMIHPDWTTIEDAAGVVPEFWEDVAFFGTVPFLLALVGVAVSIRQRRLFGVVLVWLVTIVLSMDVGITRLFYEYAPGYGLFRHPSRMLFLSSIAGIVLAGLGWQWLSSLSRVEARWHSLLLAIPLAAIMFQGAYYARYFIEMRPAEAVFPTTDYEQFLEADREVFRVASLGRATVNYGWSAHMGLELISGCDPFTFAHYRALFDILTTGRARPRGPRVWTDFLAPRRPDLMGALNVKYVISPVALPTDDRGLEFVRVFPNQPRFMLYGGLFQRDLFLYENSRDLGRAYWAHHVEPVASSRLAIAAMEAQQFTGQAIVEGSGPGLTSVAGSTAHDGIRIVGRTTDTLTIEASTDSPRYLSISEVWHPGWRASLDGRAAPLYRTNVALMGMVVPSGRHLIELEFVPLMWTSALWMLVVSSIVVLSAGYLLRTRSSDAQREDVREPG